MISAVLGTLRRASIVYSTTPLPSSYVKTMPYQITQCQSEFIVNHSGVMVPNFNITSFQNIFQSFYRSPRFFKKCLTKIILFFMVHDIPHAVCCIPTWESKDEKRRSIYQPKRSRPVREST